MALSTVMRAAVAAAIAGGTFLTGTDAALSQVKTKTTIGRVEKVWIGDADVVLRAKIDTGARTTSLGVDRIETFTRGGQAWVRFTFPDDPGAPVTLERALVRNQPLKGRDGSGTEIRPVVLLKLCVADIYRVTRVNLADRSTLNYPVLVGRRFLFGKAVVDVARQYTSEPRCAEMHRR